MLVLVFNEIADNVMYYTKRVENRMERKIDGPRYFFYKNLANKALNIMRYFVITLYIG